MTDNLAPIVLFVYNRLHHTRKTIEALRDNILADCSELFIYSDGPKKETDADRVKEVREYIRQITGFGRVIITERHTNYGLEKSVVEGVTEVIGKYGKAIVLEDDLITHRYFLKYMNKGLDIYADNPSVYSISGYSHLRENLKDFGTYFLKITSSWSWATWKDRWDKYDACCKGWEILKSNRRLRKKFDYDCSYPFYKMLDMQMSGGRINSWAVKWYWTAFKNDGLTLYPQFSLVCNSGFDGSGEHCNSKQENAQMLMRENNYENIRFEDKVEEQAQIRCWVARDLRKGLGLGGKLQIVRDVIGII